LQGYSQNHYGTASFANDVTPVDRVAVADGQGQVAFGDLRPASNTRVRARPEACGYPAEPATAVIGVRTQLTLVAARIGIRQMRISGHSTPARPGGLIVGLYRVSGSGETFIGQGRADATTGDYRMDVRFPVGDAGQAVNVVVKTGQDAQNLPGRSNVRRFVVS
ncbi:MAG: hypothetical protein LC789_13485, partial [Actinobacteria bacterium]|nr:hypothetical protein [Actinomycetota bacterium]